MAIDAEDQDIDAVREAAGELNFAFISTLIHRLNDAQWERALELVTAWGEFPAGDVLALKGGRDGVIDSDEAAREDIRKRLRLLLGLPELRDADITGAPSTTWRPTQWYY